MSESTTTEADNVTAFPAVPPKRVHEIYHQHEITAVYVPESNKWYWTIERTTRIKYDGFSDTQTDALKDARKFIDQIKGIQP